MRVSLTGTPGTGKSTVAGLLRERFRVFSVRELAEKHGCGEMSGEEMAIDTDCLNEKLRGIGDCIIEGHLSHHLEPDIIIILRCHPEILRKRLEKRGYPEGKLLENLEAEAVDVILEEALETGKPVYEIDTTEKSPEEVASCVIDIMDGNGNAYAPGKIDWSEVILSWY